jgi:hypothetical protein
MFLLGTFPFSGVLKLDLQPKNEPLLFYDQFGSYTYDFYIVVVHLSHHESFASLQQSLLLMYFGTHHVSNLSTLKFLSDASHTLFEMEFFQFFGSNNYYKKTLSREEFDPAECDVQ